jgi:hypothetical protein
VFGLIFSKPKKKKKNSGFIVKPQKRNRNVPDKALNAGVMIPTAKVIMAVDPS